MLQLHKAGIPLAVDDRYLFMFTEAFLATGVEDVEFLFTNAGSVSTASGRRRRALSLAVYTRTAAALTAAAHGARPMCVAARLHHIAWSHGTA